MKRLTDPDRVSALFAGSQDTCVWSCLQGVMGDVYANGGLTSAVAVLGDFAFFAGAPDAGMLRAFQTHAGQILVPAVDGWMPVLRETFGPKARLHTRYATVKDPAAFDRETLRSLAGVPAGCELRPIDAAMYTALAGAAWSRDLRGNYRDFAQYARLGLGFALCRDGEAVAGASSYSSYHGGIEIEVDTRADMRRQGYATVCAAALILACLDRGWYPSWDAHTPVSLALAEKLGYRFSHSYEVLEML